MSLNWDIGSIKDHEKLWVGSGEFYEEDGKQKELVRLDPVTDTLINLTMVVGMRDITKKNWKDFYLRMVMLGVEKAVMRKDEEGNFTIPISPEDVYRHIGLYTNASTLHKSKILHNAYKFRAQELGSKFKEVEEKL